MPEIARFDGISIYIRFDDHRLPHFHAIYTERDVSIAIATLEVLQGKLPKTQMQKVLTWPRSHQAELWTIWRDHPPGLTRKRLTT